VTNETDANEHSIRLRGGWECRTASSSLTESERCTLPIRWTDEAAGLVTLTRRFGRPRYDLAREALWLRLDQVPGMQSLQLNGRPLGRISPTASQYDMPLSGLLEKNRVDIELDIALAARRSASTGADWGLISLVIRSLGDRR